MDRSGASETMPENQGRKITVSKGEIFIDDNPSPSPLFKPDTKALLESIMPDNQDEIDIHDIKANYDCFVSAVIEERGSRFQMLQASAQSLEYANKFYEDVSRKPSFASATHLIVSMRTPQGDFSNSDNDYGMAEYILGKMSDAKVTNKVTILARWYGHEHIGRERQRIISGLLDNCKEYWQLQNAQQNPGKNSTDEAAQQPERLPTLTEAAREENPPINSQRDMLLANRKLVSPLVMADGVLPVRAHLSEIGGQAKVVMDATRPGDRSDADGTPPPVFPGGSDGGDGRLDGNGNG